MVVATEGSEPSESDATTTRGGRRTSEDGFATIAILMLTMVVSLTLLFMFNMSLTQLRLSRMGQNKATGLTLAEAGVEDAVDHLRLDQKYVTTMGAPLTSTLTESSSGMPRTFGSYSVRVTNLNTSTSKVISAGRNPDGTLQTVCALISLDKTPLGKAAILANGDVKISGNASVDSTPANLHIADVISNGNVSMGGASTVDGRLIAAGAASGSAYMGAQSGAASYPFPDTTTTNGWKAGWITAAQAGGTLSADSIHNGDTIMAPKYINGGISLSSHNTLTFSGSGVVFVNGDISMTAQTVIQNGVLLVVNGTFSQTGQSIYKVTTGLNLTPTLVVFGTNSSVSSDVIKLTGGSASDQQGVIYAVNGSIKVAGGSIFVGALVAGAPGAEVSATGGYTHIFPKDLASPVLFPTGASVTQIVEL
jgi:autotransporter-associated beta strand protein